jgi:hypothetical protein
MARARKITVEVPAELLDEAQRASGTGITQTVRPGLQLVAASRTYAPLRQLRGKAHTDKRRPHSSSWFLTLLPEICETNSALISSFGEMLQNVRDNETVGDLLEAIYSAAAREQSIEGNPKVAQKQVGHPDARITLGV